MSATEFAEGDAVLTVSLEGADDGTTAGSKASRLSSLISLGYEVPQGFVVTAASMRLFINDNNLGQLIDESLQELSSEDYLVASFAAARIRDAIVQGTLPAAVEDGIASQLHSQGVGPFAVRSSGGFEDGVHRSWAGQFDSYLNVEAADVSDYVKRCWASLFGSRAVNYGRESSEPYYKLPFGVIVQVMVHGEASGVCFSVLPGSTDEDKMLIEAVIGTGDRLVSGQETPYSLVVDKQDGIVLRREYGGYRNRDLLSGAAIQDLTKAVTSIEKNFGYPVDIEWTVAEGVIHVLQARPITASIDEKQTGVHDVRGLPDILDYELTFKVSGLGFLFADLLTRGFGYLRPLFTSRHGDFRQYFPKERMEYAAREGYRWLSRSGGFAEYRKSFEVFHSKAAPALKAIVESAPSPSGISSFFAFTEQYFEFYSKMDFQFTNLTYLYADSDPTVMQNLHELAAFKDIARVWVNETTIDDDSLFAKLLDGLGSQYNLEATVLDAYTIAELIALEDGARVGDDVIATRQLSYAVYVDHGQVRYVAGEKAADYTDSIARVEESLSSSEIVGQVANDAGQSRVEGRVSVINVDYGDIDRMEREIAEMPQGAILVSEFTAPELMGACRKATAIITDLGGMLSHAAIVSRELSIPCLVGTQHASRALRDGDSIVVDLATGTVERSR